MAVAQMVVAARRYALKAKARDVLSLVAYTALLLASAWGLSGHGTSFSKALPLLAGIAALGALGTGMISLRGLRSVMQLREDR